MTMPAYDRPVEATLHVHLANGETWEAKPDDLAKFGLTRKIDAYMRFDDALSATLRTAGLIHGDITDAALNPVRYLVDTAINYPDLLEHSDHRGWRNVVAIERALATLAAQLEALPPLPWTFNDPDVNDPPYTAVDANGDELTLTNLVLLEAFVKIANAGAGLIADR